MLADSFYGESSAFVSSLDALHLAWIVAIRSNHGLWMPNEVEVTTSQWHRFERVFSDGTTQERYIQEIIFGRSFEHRYWRSLYFSATLQGIMLMYSTYP